VLHAFAHKPFVLLITDGTVFLAFGEKVIGGKVTLVDQRLHFYQVTNLLLTLQLYQIDFIGK